MFNTNKIVLFCILFLGLFLRLYGNNWDQGWHLHPDERFLTMVGVAVKIPSSIATYLDQHASSFNPVNKGNSFFVYGTFPILINKVAAQLLSQDTYEFFNLQGRSLSAVADFFVILIIFKIVELVEKKLKLAPSVKYLSAFFYAIAVLPIQLSHFFTVDTFLNLFCWLSLYFAVRFNVLTFKRLNVLTDSSLSGLFLGLAFACKVSAVYFAPLVGAFILIKLVSLSKLKMRVWIPACAGMTLFILFFYLALRLGSPYYFETNNLFNPQLSTVFTNSLNTLKSYENPQGFFPPAIQWLSKSYGFSLKNIIFFGVGPFYFVFSIIGIILLLKKKNIYIAVSIAWVIVLIIYQSFQFTKTMRYLIVIYPFLAIFAAVGLSFITKKINLISKPLCYMLHVTCYIVIFFWPLAFMSIYTKDHSRVEASKWIFENIPPNSKLTYEYWDDSLPLAVQDPSTRNYQGIEIHIFDPDTKEKWNIINNQLSNADYYIMTSNRGWGSIGEAPNSYPLSSDFYKSMFKNTYGFTFVKKISSYPSLRYLGIPLEFPDQWSEEAFTVYDHPEVIIFKKNLGFL